MNQTLITVLRYSITYYQRTYLYVLSIPTNTKQQLCIKPTGFLVSSCFHRSVITSLYFTLTSDEASCRIN